MLSKLITPVLITTIVYGQTTKPPSDTRLPVYRYWSGSLGDHFYTNDFSEIGLDEGGNYNYEGIGFYLVEEGKNTIPLYRYWSRPVKDHFYTTSSSEIGTTTVGEYGNYNYIYEGILGYCYAEEFARDDMVPLYRYWKSSISDHFYTIHLSEIGAGLEVGEYGRYDYRYEGVQCYVYAEADDRETLLDKEMREHPVPGPEELPQVGMPFMAVNGNPEISPDDWEYTCRSPWGSVALRCESYANGIDADAEDAPSMAVDKDSGLSSDWYYRLICRELTDGNDPEHLMRKEIEGIEADIEISSELFQDDAPSITVKRNPVDKIHYDHYAIIAISMASFIVGVFGTLCFVNWKRIKTLNVDAKSTEYDPLL